MNTSTRLPFIDFFKCFGMALIVYGHTAGWAPLATFPPIYLKQLGVALFLFVLGYSLAREARPTREVLFNRLFEVYVFGLSCAVLLTLYSLMADGRWGRSNYLPFALGVNVLMDDFPANPTTWYIGTYVHFLLIWALVLRPVRMRLNTLAMALGFEVVARALILQYAGNHTAYMTVPNWLTVFLLGYYLGQRRVETVRGPRWLWAGALVACGSAWLAIGAQAPLVRAFPFMRPVAPTIFATLALSCSISAVYLGSAWFAFAIFSRAKPVRFVEFIARNTILIFIAHMPLVYVMLQILPDTPDTVVWRSVVLMVVCLPGLAVVSHFARHSRVIGSIRAWLRTRVIPDHAGVDRPAALTTTTTT
jgi:peptidoglycan/LPS O-acetylase OafA/YrhL